MVVSIPLNTFMARIMKTMQEKQMKNRDKRTRLMSELLANIRRCVSHYIVFFLFPFLGAHIICSLVAFC